MRGATFAVKNYYYFFFLVSQFIWEGVKKLSVFGVILFPFHSFMSLKLSFNSSMCVVFMSSCVLVYQGPLNRGGKGGGRSPRTFSDTTCKPMGVCLKIIYSPRCGSQPTFHNVPRLLCMCVLYF